MASRPARSGGPRSFSGGRIPVARLEVRGVDAWTGRLRRGSFGEGAIRNQLQTLRSALAQAVRWGWISQNPAALASYERPKRTPRGVMSAEEVQRVLDASVEVHEMAPVALRLAAITGARRAELAALRWCEVVDGVIAIGSAMSVVREPTDVGLVTVLRDDPTKTGDQRAVALDDETVEVLDEMRVVQEPVSPWLFSDGPEPPHPGSFVRRAGAPCLRR